MESTPLLPSRPAPVKRRGRADWPLDARVMDYFRSPKERAARQRTFGAWRALALERNLALRARVTGPQEQLRRMIDHARAKVEGALRLSEVQEAMAALDELDIFMRARGITNLRHTMETTPTPPRLLVLTAQHIIRRPDHMYTMSLSQQGVPDCLGRVQRHTFHVDLRYSVDDTYIMTTVDCAYASTVEAIVLRLAGMYDATKIGDDDWACIRGLHSAKLQPGAHGTHLIASCVNHDGDPCVYTGHFKHRVHAQYAMDQIVAAFKEEG
jgi:hypothetical protein